MISGICSLKYFEYMQEARIDLLRLDERPAGEPELSVVVVAVDVEYSRPVLLRPEPYPERPDDAERAGVDDRHRIGSVVRHVYPRREPPRRPGDPPSHPLVDVTRPRVGGRRGAPRR